MHDLTWSGLIYSITGQQLDLASIWRSQAVSATVAEMLEMLAASVWEHLTNPPTSVRNVSEWSKKLACWETLTQRSVDLPATMAGLLLGGTIAGDVGLRHSSGVGTAMEGIPAVAWIALARWGDETGNLKYWERGLAQTLADYVVKRKQPTPKQAKHGIRIFSDAISAGFTPPG